jgi:uncharacterized membrane protein YkoI
MNSKQPLNVAAVVVLAMLWCGAAATGSAQEKTQPKGKTASAQTLTSSVQVPPGEKDPAKLQAAAKVGADTVKAAAIEMHKGWPVKYVMVKNLKGNLVYEVEFTDDQEYWFDAGTGEQLNGKVASKMNEAMKKSK